MTRSFGYRPDAHDPRAPRYGLPSSALVLPARLDLTEHAPTQVLDQSSTEACVGYALAAVSYGKQSIEGLAPVLPSPGFIWWNSRHRHGDEALNVGTYPSVAVQTLNELGLCPEEDWPISRLPWNFDKRPSALSYHDAYDARFDVRSLLLDADKQQVKSAMVTHGPLAFGMDVTEGYVDLGAHELVKGPVGEVKGGHYQAIFGYDEDGVFVLGSWGLYWGNAGWAKIAWGHFLDVASDVACFRFMPKVGD